jgi:hypothetical protein
MIVWMLLNSVWLDDKLPTVSTLDLIDRPKAEEVLGVDVKFT